jgi:hypothetical protein
VQIIGRCLVVAHAYYTAKAESRIEEYQQWSKSEQGDVWDIVTVLGPRDVREECLPFQPSSVVGGAWC